MKRIEVKQDPRVKEKFATYPLHVKPKMNRLRELIITVASGLPDTDELEETLKWGEPSYSVKKGSPIRMDWKPRTPQQYALYFICHTNLVETFRLLYGDLFRYEKNRALLFDLHEKIPEKQLKECIAISLQYHTLKNKPMMGR